MSKRHKRSATTQRKGFLSLMPKQLSTSDIALKNLFQLCSKLTVDRFEDCIVRHDLTALIIDPGGAQPSTEQMQEVWDIIYTEFCQLSQSESYNELFEKQKEIAVLKAKLYLVDQIVKALQLSYSKELVGILNHMGLQCDLKPEHTGNTLVTKINAVIGRAKKWIITIEQRQGDIEKLREAKTDEMDSNYFDDCLEGIGMFTGHHVKASDITVSRFCRVLNRMKEDSNKKELKKLLHGS